MRKAIVTGATGFIGRWVTRELVKQGVEVIAVVREKSGRIGALDGLPVRIVECSLNEIDRLPFLITDRDIDAVFHVAWQGVSDADICNEGIQIQNLQSTLMLLDAMYEMSISTFVGAGSFHEAESIIEMSKNKRVANLGYMYNGAKIAAHWMGKAKAGAYGIRFFWPVINTYGEEETSARLLNTIIRKVLSGESPELSEGYQMYDFVHVSDVAHALYLIARSGVDGSNYVIGSGHPRPLREFLFEVGDVANKLHNGDYVPLGFGKHKGTVINLPAELFDITRLQQDTGFVPQISFEEGIERTAKWIISMQK